MPRIVSPKIAFIPFLVAFALLAAACGSSDTTRVETADGSAESEPAGGDSEDYAPGDPTDPADDALPEGPIPVEPDGGIGDGAQPLPGAEEPVDDGTWHGAEVAETNCPGVEWQRVQASAFSFSVPADFVDNQAQGVDSEVGIWTGGNKVEVTYDYGWYSGNLSTMEGAVNEPIDYSGIVGQQTVIRDMPGKHVSVYFGQVQETAGEWDKLSLDVNFTDPADEIIGRCVVGSIEWNL